MPGAFEESVPDQLLTFELANEKSDGVYQMWKRCSGRGNSFLHRLLKDAYE